MGAGRTSWAASEAPGELIRRKRKEKGLTLVQLGKLAGFSAAQVSRYERGVSALTDVAVLRSFADALGIAPQALGLTSGPAGNGHAIAPADYPRLPTSKVQERSGREDGEDPVRRRQLLANLAVTAATAAGAPLLLTTTGGPVSEAALGPVLITRLRDAMLGLHPGTDNPLPPEVDLTRAYTDFRACRYGSLATRLPRLLHAGHAHAGGDGNTLLAQTYLLVVRVLIKLDDQQLGWMAADRARQYAEATGDALFVAEAARHLAVLARKARWYEQAMNIALTAAEHPELRPGGPEHAAGRGLLIQSAAYTAAKCGDAAGMRELTTEAATIADGLGRTLLPDHGGFSTTTVRLHLISAELSAGDPAAALTAARMVAPQTLPSTERRARYYTDVATAFAQWGRREQCLRALLTAESHAPEETHLRPAVKSLVTGLLVSGHTTAELRGLAARVGVPA
ncbi:helix-turn-helix domain-containing protein [Saccharopolyspora sp. ASAGF58]|uniref:helix-turn-helix domain-containing protein n=1 Tax=Saccharopolyspora sp. ASAGF58 TaxID=2719023 RepID=UPI0014402600|nr:helix-turn-helix transcriptional regulator [Saccharopolyspora sp. ASAGF58]QIZ37954.1 helix-turn-helix transcriptional regulator [Saccharopolyspora sp. ASAGF58]